MTILCQLTLDKIPRHGAYTEASCALTAIWDLPGNCGSTALGNGVIGLCSWTQRVEKRNAEQREDEQGRPEKNCEDVWKHNVRP